MNITINAKQLRASLPEMVRRVRQGARYTVLYRSTPAFRIVPVEDAPEPRAGLKVDSLFHAPAVGRSTDGRSAADHDEALYGA
jgi:prevent-host-death family protein